ncbi:AHH domain-containing protein [Lentisphaera profundi]|uniref:AHH domain-containing protein n=1 Tax=Lentisphaera profundi TaxID=1658616 RepID=A0ABY7W3A7_9BACT|nr:AHH domain-containing protein [Lentisphaera profundi]WDE99476.1 AHH domain-containing protein [Lentisphaera profundi]
MDWADLTEKHHGSAPQGMIRPHGHHKVFKKGIGKKMQRYAKKSQEILEKYGIDWKKGKDNLMWASNVKGVHTTDVAKQVYAILKRADATGGRSAVVRALNTEVEALFMSLSKFK